MTTTTQKINLNKCTQKKLFKAIHKIQAKPAKAAATFVKDDVLDASDSAKNLSAH